jgi:hypothetical protein
MKKFHWHTLVLLLAWLIVVGARVWRIDCSGTVRESVDGFSCDIFPDIIKMLGYLKYSPGILNQHWK